MTIEVCSSSGTSPVEYAKRLQQLDTDNTTQLKEESNHNTLTANQPILDASRALDISA